MVSPRPDQVLNLAAAQSPDSQPSPHAEVRVDSSRQPAPDGEVDLSADIPTPASAVMRDSSAEVNLHAKFRQLGEVHIGGHGPTIGAAFAYLLIVGAASGASVTITNTPWGEGNPWVSGAVFLVVLVLGVWGNKLLKS